MTRLKNLTLPRAGTLIAATVALALAGGLTLAGATASPMHGGKGMGMNMMGGPMMGGQHLDRMLDAVSASADQRTQIKAIMAAAQKDLRAQHEAARPLHEQMLQLFAQPAVDARSAEALRQQMLAQHDQASKRTMQAMLDASRVLSPEQRQKIGEQMAQRRTMMEQHRGAHEMHDKPKQ